VAAVVGLGLGLTGCVRRNASRTLVDSRWGQIQGLMAGITVTHAVQPVAAAVGELPWKDKYYISIGGGVLYGATLVGLTQRHKWALYVALIGPAVGASAVFGGWALDAAGVIDATIKPDAFQIAGGTLQGAAWLIALQLLKIDPRFCAPTVTTTEDARIAGLRVVF